MVKNVTEFTHKASESMELPFPEKKKVGTGTAGLMLQGSLLSVMV
jgi:hypothetical protein